jgi:cutinase
MLTACTARGTTEPLNPDYGIIVGDPLYTTTKTLIPSLTGYKVDYPASFAKTSKETGAADVVKHLDEQSKACPQQDFVLVGYSQGADVMHLASRKIPAALYPRIVALVMFGDPGNRGPNSRSPLGGIVSTFPEELQNKLKENCEKGDPVCTNSGTTTDDHLVYHMAEKNYMTSSASYIKKQLDTKGKAGPDPSPNGGVKDKGDNSEALKKLGKELGATDTEITDLQGAAGIVPKSRS